MEHLKSFFGSLAIKFLEIRKLFSLIFLTRCLTVFLLGLVFFRESSSLLFC